MFRGVLCRDCNRYVVGKFEENHRFHSVEHEALIRQYLEDPPYRRWLASLSG